MENNMKRNTIFTLAVTAVLGLAIAIPGGDASAQEKQRVSYKVSAENTKFTQRLFIDVGDAPGHQVRAYEIHRTYPSNPPMINGVKLVESWTRATADYTDGDGTNAGYTVYLLESGDKFFSRFNCVGQSAGAGRSNAPCVAQITGGVGKFAGIRGVIRSFNNSDAKAGFNEVQTDIEYSMEK
jgi:hypothetical protein